MRIIQVVDRLKNISGVAHAIMNYYRAIDRDAVQFDFLVNEYDAQLKEEVESLGGTVTTIPKLSLTNYRKVCVALHTFFDNTRGVYQILHSNFYQIDWLVFPIAKKYGITCCISHSHSTKYSDHLIRAIRNAIFSWPLRKHATHYMACSRKAGEFLFGKRSVKKKSLFVLNNAINISRFRFDSAKRESVRNELELSDAVVMGHVGRFCKQKNQLFLLEIFQTYLTIEPTARLLLIGTGEDEAEFVRIAEEKGIFDKITILHNRSDVPDLLAAMDVFVFPSTYEGLGIALVEAQASGLPCVASTEIPEEAAVSEHVSFLSLKAPIDDWVNEVCCLRAKASARENATISDRFDLSVAAKQLESFYMNIANKQ